MQNNLAVCIVNSLITFLHICIQHDRDTGGKKLVTLALLEC